MCLIAHIPAGVDYSETNLAMQWAGNSDGAGIAFYVNENTIVISKGLMTPEDTLIALDSARRFNRVLHLRYGTSGNKTPYQTHPFILSPESWEASKGSPKPQRVSAKTGVLFHNGILNGLGDNKYSDTLELSHKVLSCLDCNTRRGLLSNLPGKYVLMQNGQVWLFGQWTKPDKDGIEYSNDYWDIKVTPSRPYLSGNFSESDLMDLPEWEREMLSDYYSKKQTRGKYNNRLRRFKTAETSDI